MDSLEARIALLEKQMAGVLLTLDPDNQARMQQEREDDSAIPDMFQTGKHRGKTHAWVLANDPGWVVWCIDNGKAIADGFTPEEVQQARDAYARMPQPSRR